MFIGPAYAGKETFDYATPTAEVQYIAITKVSKQLTGAKLVYVDYLIIRDCDYLLKHRNMAALEIILKPHGTTRRNYIDLRHQEIAHIISNSRVGLSHVASSWQITYMLIKPMARFDFERQCQALHIVQRRWKRGL